MESKDRICRYDKNMPPYVVDETCYFYQPCVNNLTAEFAEGELLDRVRECLDYNNYSRNHSRCFQFCDGFERILPPIYGSISCLSALCCFGVFLTYFGLPRLRISGYSSKVFLYRTLMNLVIALGHIVAMIFQLSKAESGNTLTGCKVIGVINEIALIASNLWYVMLAVDLLKAIRNPFSSQPSYKPLAHLIVWGFSFTCGAVLTILTLKEVPGAAGQSMFYWCWVGTAIFSDQNFDDKRRKIVVNFAAVTLSLYYFWHFAFWIFSVCVLIVAFWILRGHLAASSETRKFVLKQNFYYVLVLGIETSLIIPIWIAQLSITKQRISSRGDFYKDYHRYYPYYFSYIDLGLAIAFAVIHSSRGIVDLLVWLGTFTIGYADMRELCWRIKRKYKRLKDPDGFVSLHSHSPLIDKTESTVDRALRRNAMYCINIGILDAVTLHMQHQQRVGKVGLVDDSFVAAAMMQFDEENQQQATAELYRNNPNHREQSLRKIQFPPSSALGIAGFSFIDLEPSVFNMLRDCYGIDPHQYRASFRIRNAADIESSGMLEKFTEGKSGSFFYFTRDFKYIIKTVTDEEEKFLQKIAYRYYDHMKNNPNSLIVRFLGLHKVQLAKEQRFITVVVMENIFYNTEQFKMNERYDLKGSRISRRSVKKTSMITREYKGTLKDLDLGDKKIHVGADSKAELLGQLRRDVEFLIKCKIMDYSMLLGIHNHTDDERSRVKVREGSIRGLGDSFIDVQIEKEGEKKHTVRADAATMKSFRGRLSSGKSSGYNTRSSTLDSIDESGDIMESQFHTKKPQIAWFREDYGGLRSSSTLHPLHKAEVQLHESSLEEQATAEVPSATYYFGIVDILQQYNLQKKVEHHWKTKVACKDKHGISCVNEREYGERFLNFMDEIFV